MGAGFTARHVCTFHTRGLEIKDELESLREELFVPLQKRGLFQHPGDLTALFSSIYKRVSQVFSSPKFEIGNPQTKFLGQNLPLCVYP